MTERVGIADAVVNTRREEQPDREEAKKQSADFSRFSAQGREYMHPAVK